MVNECYIPYTECLGCWFNKTCRLFCLIIFLPSSTAFQLKNKSLLQVVQILEYSRNDRVHTILTMAIGDHTLSVATWLSLFLLCRVVEGWTSHVLNSISRSLIVNDECEQSIFTTQLMTLDKQSARFCHATSSASSTLFWFHSFALPSHSFSNGPVPKLQSLSQGAGDRVSGFLGGAAKSYAGTYKDEDHTEVPMCSTGRIGSLLMLIDGNPMTSCIVCIVCTDLLQFGSKDLQCGDSHQCDPSRI